MDKQAIIDDEHINDEQQFIENLVVYGKEISMAVAKDKSLEDKIKRLSSY